MVWTHSNRVCKTVRYHNKIVKVDRQTVFSDFFGFLYTNHGVWVQANVQNYCDRSRSLKIEQYEAMSTIFFGSKMFNAKWRDHMSYGFSEFKCQIMQSICRKVGKKLRRPSLHAFILHCGQTLAQIASPNTLTDPYIRFLPKAQPYLIFMTRTPKSKPYFITLPKYTVFLHCWVVYAILLLCWTTTCFITLLS